MDLSTEDSTTLAVDSSFRTAKLEHFVERAGELVQMSRYGAALRMLDLAFSLEPDCKPAFVLHNTIEQNLKELSQFVDWRTNGHHRRGTKRGELVLVVDQDERILTSMNISLRKYGFAAVGAASFDEAIEVLSRFKPDLIISEVNFDKGPVGFDLFFWIRNNSEFSTRPFLYLATHVTREMLIAGKRLGVDEFILKPLDEEVVMASIISCLSRRKKRVY